jgi:hypothetical protein
VWIAVAVVLLALSAHWVVSRRQRSQ